MSNATDAEAILAREAAGESLTAAEYRTLATCWANRAVAHAQVAVRWARLSLIAALVAAVIALIAVLT